MKRKIFCVVIVLILVLASMSIVAWAATPATLTVAGIDVAQGGVWVNDGNGGITATNATDENYNVKYENGVLTLKDAEITNTSTDSGIYSSGGDLTIILEGNNTIRVNASYGLQLIGGNLTITGYGSLKTESTTTSSASYGMYLQNRNLTIENSTITAIAMGDDRSYGIYVGNITIENGSFTGISESGASLSYGVRAGLSSEVNNSRLIGISTSNDSGAYGVRSGSSLDVENDSTVIGQGETAIYAANYNVGTEAIWSGSNEQAAFTAGPRIGPNNSTYTSYAIIATPYTLTTDDTIAVTPSNSTNQNQYPKGVTLSITAQQQENKTFKNWASSNNAGTFGDISAETTTFTIPAEDVTLTANYEDNPVVPDIPDTPTTPVSGNTETKDNTKANTNSITANSATPATGDDSSLGIYIVIMVMAGFAVIRQCLRNQ